MAPSELTIWSFALNFVLSIVLFDAWFFWSHRLQHMRLLYRFYQPHHLSVAPTVWSTDAISSVDTLIAHAYFALIALIAPIPALVLVATRLFDQVTATIGHSGFEHFASPTMRRPFPFL